MALVACIFEFMAIGIMAVVYGLLQPHWPFVSALITIVFMGSRMRAIGNMAHECAHNIFSTNRTFNSICGNIFCIFDFRSFQKYKREHMAHHRFLGDKGRDPDYLGRDFNVLSYLKHFLPTLYSRHDTTWVNGLRLTWFLTLLALALHPMTRQFVMVCYVLPFFTSYFLLRVFSDFSDHWGLADNEDRDLRSRNHAFKSNILNYLLLPRNDGFHLLHHLFPNLPTWCYKSVHKELMATNTAYRRLHHED